MADPQKFSDMTRVLYVMNLPYDASKEEVCNFFTNYEVEHVELIKLKSGNPSGKALAQFSTKNQADTALREKDGKQIRGRTIHLSLAQKNEVRDYNDGEFCAKVRRYDDDSRYAREFDRNREHYDYFSSDILHDMNAGFKEVLAQITKIKTRAASTDKRITAMEKSTGERITHLDQRITSMEKSTGERFTELEKAIDKRFTRMEQTLDNNFAKIANNLNFEKFSKK